MTPDERHRLIHARDHADRLVDALALSILTVTTQRESLEAALRGVSDVRTFSKDREVRVRARNLRRAELIIRFEIEKVSGARDNLTRQLAAARGVTTE